MRAETRKEEAEKRVQFGSQGPACLPIASYQSYYLQETKAQLNCFQRERYRSWRKLVEEPLAEILELNGEIGTKASVCTAASTVASEPSSRSCRLRSSASL